MKTREKVHEFARQGKTTAEICAITGISRPTVCKYRQEICINKEKNSRPNMPIGFWDEWEAAVSVLLGRKKGKNEDKGDEI